MAAVADTTWSDPLVTGPDEGGLLSTSHWAGF